MADTLTLTDNRTGKQYEIPITDGTIRAIDLRQIKVTPDEFGMMLTDPEQKIARPRQIYTGSGKRDYVPRDKRR